jgi:NPCBM/NEW2 domain-containing protein
MSNRFSLILFCLMVAPLAGAEEPRVVLVEGESFAARLGAVDDRWMISFVSGDGSRDLPAVELVRWGELAEIERGPVVVLADGGLLVGDVLEADKEELKAESNVLGAIVHLPARLVAGIVFDPPADRLQRRRLLDQVREGVERSDRVILANDDSFNGRFDRIEDGVIHLITDVGSVELDTRRTRAVVFNRTFLRRSAARGLDCRLGLADGSLLVVESLLVKGKTATLGMAGGPSWPVRLEDVVFLQPRGGRAVYLSDLKPAGYRHVPFLDLSWPYSVDRNLSGAPLRAGGRTYLKGIGMHSASRLTYLTEGRYGRFDALLAVDDAAAGQGSVRFRVFVDGNPKFTSDTLRGGDPPVPIFIDISGANRIDLVVDFADRADQWDHADWLDARFARQ